MVKKGSAKVAKKTKLPKYPAAASGRQKKLTRSQKKDKAKKEVGKRSPLKGSFALTKSSVLTIKAHWKVLFGIVAVYLLLNIIFASGISSLSNAVDTIKYNLESTGGSFGTALNGFSTLIASSGTSSSSTGSVLQTVLIVLESLIIIWALRHLMAGKQIRVKEAYYSATAPLIPFILVLVVLFIQFLPLLLGTSIVSAILSAVFVGGGGAAVTIFVFFFALFAGWTFYMISSSLFAIYIVTLPDMQPRQALRSAKNLVKYRRWQIMRKLFFLPIVIFVAMAAVVVPLIIFATFLVAPVFFALSMFALLFAHTYLYSLYRNLLE